MTPLKFKEATVTLGRPGIMTDEQCKSLHVHQSSDRQCISLWTAPLWTRLKFLFHGKLWLGIHSGATQPPVWLDITRTVFIKKRK